MAIGSLGGALERARTLLSNGGQMLGAPRFGAAAQKADKMERVQMMGEAALASYGLSYFTGKAGGEKKILGDKVDLDLGVGIAATAGVFFDLIPEEYEQHAIAIATGALSAFAARKGLQAGIKSQAAAPPSTGYAPSDDVNELTATLERLAQ